MSPIKSFNFARTSFLTFIQELDERIIDRQDPAFAQTIRWHIGNVLFVHEKLMFVSQKHSQNIPKEYAELFSSDISVSDWNLAPPSLEQLINDLINQQQRINQFDELFWKSEVKFKVPYGQIQTHGDLLIVLSHRESEALGKIKMIKDYLDSKQG